MTTLSVLLANYNHGHHIAEAIESVTSQSRLPDEYIIMDDGSTDDSVAIISSFAEQHPFIRFIRNEKNLGAVAAYRKLLEMAAGDYLFCSAADDFILPEFLSRSMALLEAHPQAGLVSGLSMICDEDGRKTGIFPTPIVSRTPAYLDPKRVKRALVRYGAWFMGNTTVYRRQALSAEGGFRSDLGPFIDGFACHVLALKYGACFIPEPCAVWRRLDTGESSSVALDPEEASALVSRTASLMVEDPSYRGLFPPAYVRAWQRRQKYWVGMAIQRFRERQQAEHAQRVRTSGQASTVYTRAAASLLKLGFRAQSLWVKVALLAQSFSWPSSVLMLRWLVRDIAFKRALRK